MSIGGRRLGFDITDADTILASDNVGSWLRAGTDGDQLSSTNVGGKEGLDVNIINPITVDLDGVYDGVNNLDPDNVGAIFHVRAATPGDTDQTKRTTGAAGSSDAIVAANFHGIGKSTISNDGGNTVTVQAADADLFINAVGGLVMLVEADGTTRSADTPNGSPRKIVSVSGAVVTLDGAALADADGSGVNAPIYLCYYEPATPAAINDPVTGLTGSVTIPGLGYQCIRSLQVTVANNHELRNDCYGEDSAGGSIFVAGDRLTATVNMEMNLNKESFKLLKRVTEFEAQDITLVLGEATGRRFELELPKVDFSTPTVNVPDTGSIPIPFADGLALQTGLDTKDEITASYL